MADLKISELASLVDLGTTLNSDALIPMTVEVGADSQTAKVKLIELPFIFSINSILDLESVTSPHKFVIVKELKRGGLFKYESTGFTTDNGVVFEATGIGSGHWVRQYQGAVELDWFGIDTTGTNDMSSLMNSVIAKYPEVSFPAGTIKGEINNRTSNRTLIFNTDTIIDGGVIHLAIGHGPSNPDWASGDTVEIVKNIRVKGKLRTTSRLGTYYCDGVYLDDVEIVKGGTSPCRGVHIHYGSKNVYIDNIVTNADTGGDYGIAINGGTGATAFTGIERTENVYINQIVVNDSVETGVSLIRVTNIQIGKIVASKWGGSASGFYGLNCTGVIDSYIGDVYIDSSSSSNVNNQSIRIGACSNFNIGKAKVINSSSTGVICLANYTDSFFTSPTSNTYCYVGDLFVSNSRRTGLFIGGGGINLGNVTLLNNNQDSDANSWNLLINTSTTGTRIDNLIIDDNANKSNGFSIINSSKIYVANAEIRDGNTYGLLIQGTSSDITFDRLLVANCAQNIRTEGTISNVTIRNLISTGATVRDFTNINAVNFSLGYTGSLVFLNNPYAQTGFVKLNTQYTSSAPTSGQHYVGHTYYNNAPASAGFIGWVCTASGNPGTWNTFGLIS
jgi:hypothetical protein